MILIPASLSDKRMQPWLECVINTEDAVFCQMIFEDDYEAYQDWSAQNKEYDV